MLPAAAPVLEVYYSPTCAPCRLELPAIAEIVRDGVHVRIVLLDQVERAKTELGAVSPALAGLVKVAPQGAPRSILRAAGNGDGILPYARSLAADGTICARWLGRLTAWRARTLVAACARAVSGPSHRRS